MPYQQECFRGIFHLYPTSPITASPIACKTIEHLETTCYLTSDQHVLLTWKGSIQWFQTHDGCWVGLCQGRGQLSSMCESFRHSWFRQIYHDLFPCLMKKRRQEHLFECRISLPMELHKSKQMYQCHMMMVSVGNEECIIEKTGYVNPQHELLYLDTDEYSHSFGKGMGLHNIIQYPFYHPLPSREVHSIQEWIKRFVPVFHHSISSRILQQIEKQWSPATKEHIRCHYWLAKS